MTRQEIRTSFGAPDDVDSSGNWVYDVWWGNGWAEVRFDDQQLHYHTHVESPFD